MPLTARSPIEPPGKRSGLTTNESVVMARRVAAGVDGARVGELLERPGAERGDEQALDQPLRRLAARAVRHRDVRVAELRLLAAGGLDDPEDLALALGDRVGRAHTSSRSRAKRP